MNTPLWTPRQDQIEKTNLFDFASVHGFMKDGVVDYPALHAWSIDDMDAFWSSLWDTCQVVGDKGTAVFASGDHITKAQFFPEARLNFAENLLAFTGSEDAIVASGEGSARKAWSRDEVRAAAINFAVWLEEQGVRQGDRVAAIVANIPEAIIAMLGTSAIGAVFPPVLRILGKQESLIALVRLNQECLLLLMVTPMPQSPSTSGKRQKAWRAACPAL